MYTLSVQSEIPAPLSSIVEALMSGVHDPEIRQAVGSAAEELTRAHLFGLAAKRHRPNVAQNFYEDAAWAVKFDDSGDSVDIRIDKAGMAQRYHGGKIKAVNYSHLWIPVAPESEGKSAGDFDDLVPIISPLTNRGVALSDGKVLFALVEETREQDPDPSVLPTDEEYEGVVADAVSELVDRLMALHNRVEAQP